MIENIINGIAIKLNQVFGSGYKIYTENIKQGLKEPCFSIVVLEPEQSAKLPNRYFRSYPIDVHYFPKSTDKPKAEMYSVAEKLLVELEYITVKDNDVDNLCRGSKMRYEIVDGVLHFFVNYDLFVKKQAVVGEYMEELTINSKAEE